MIIEGEITLIAYDSKKDSKGIWQTPDKTETTVFCKVDSVSQSEFFSAGQLGLKSELRFTIHECEYSGQENLVYNSIPYVIYRTYRKSIDEIELYCKKETGGNKC